MQARNPVQGSRAAQRGEAGFTLVEALVAIIVLVFGLMAVTNLMLVAASSNTVANQGTAAVTSATRVMDLIKTTSMASAGAITMPIGGDPFDPTDAATAKECSDTTLQVNEWHCLDTVPGVGVVHTHWWITATTDPRLLHIRVQSEGTGALAAARSRANFTTFRACTNTDPAAGGQCPS
jgi:type II secretory pathway pseudopilin PulG